MVERTKRSGVEGVKTRLKDAFRANLPAGAAQRAFQRASIRLGVSLDRKTLKAITRAGKEADLRTYIEKEADKERAKADRCVGSEAAGKFFESELETCKKALDKGDVDAILRFTGGKE